MSVEFHRKSPGKFDSRTLNRETLSRWTGRTVHASLRASRRACDNAGPRINQNFRDYAFTAVELESKVYKLQIKRTKCRQGMMKHVCQLYVYIYIYI